MHNAHHMADRPQSRQAEPRALAVVIPLARGPFERACQLARSGNSDTEIAAALIAEQPEGYDGSAIADLIASPQLSARLQHERLAGRALLRDYLYRAATPERPTKSSIQLAQWLSRQLLGYSARGLDDEIADVARELDGLSDEQIVDRLRKAIDG